MIKFYRRIRRNLIDEGKLTRYLIYAVGEILLVVIGILIALQINTWNEITKDKKEELLALKDLKVEFQSNKEDLEKILTYKQNVENLWQAYLTKVSDKNVPDSIKALDRPTLGNRIFNISNIKLNSLLNTGNIDKIQNDSLKDLLLSWNDILQSGRYPETRFNEFTQNVFGPYEASIKIRPKEAMKAISGIDISFYSEDEIKKMNIAALDYILYQNYLIQILHWLTIQVNASKDLSISYDEVIRLIDQEIREKKR